MSLEAVAWALKQQIEDPIAKLVLVSLADHHNGSTGKCFPGRARLAEAGCCSERTVQRKLAWLSSEGWISITPYFEPSTGRQDRNGYVIHFGRKGGRQPDALPDEAAETAEKVGGQSDALPPSEAQGGRRNCDPHEGDRAVSPLNRKNNRKNGHAGEAETPCGEQRVAIGLAMKDLARSLSMSRIEGGR